MALLAYALMLYALMGSKLHLVPNKNTALRLYLLPTYYCVFAFLLPSYSLLVVEYLPLLCSK